MENPRSWTRDPAVVPMPKLLGIQPVPNETGPLEFNRRPVSLNHASAALYAYRGADPVVVKPLRTYEEELAEAFGHLMCRVLDLRTPDAWIWHGKSPNYSGVHWVTAQISPAQGWDPALWHQVSNPQDIAGMVVVDALMGNSDRHVDNVLLQQEISETLEPSVSAWLIDHGGAAAGRYFDFRNLGSKARSPHERLFLPREELRAKVEEVAQTAAALSSQIREAATVAVQSVSSPSDTVADTLGDAMALRCLHAKRIASDYLGQVPQS